MSFTIPTEILSMIIMFIQYLVLPRVFVLNILSIKQILNSIKGHNSDANLQKNEFYNPNIDLARDNVYTIFGLIQSMRSPVIEQKPKSELNQKPLICCKCKK